MIHVVCVVLQSIRCNQLVLMNLEVRRSSSTHETPVIQHIFGGCLQLRNLVSTLSLIIQFAINESAYMFALFLISSKFLRDLFLKFAYVSVLSNPS